MKILGLIPARGGSKGIPGKNLKMLGDKKLLEYTVESALESKGLTDIVLSTDDAAIAEAGQKAGVWIPFLRPAELAADDTPTLPVVIHALNFLRDSGKEYDAVCLLQPTTPFRKRGFIDQAISTFSKGQTDSLISVLPVPHEYNPHWVFEPTGINMLRIATGEKKIIPRRQELPRAYFRDGCVYITLTSVVTEKNSLYGESIGYIESDPSLYVNLDTLSDWQRAEMLLPRFKQ